IFTLAMSTPVLSDLTRTFTLKSTTRFTGTRTFIVRAPSERGDARLRTPQDQRMHVVRALIGVHHLEIHQVTRDAELVADSVAAQHVARQAGDVQCLAARIALHDRSDLDGRR